MCEQAFSNPEEKKQFVTWLDDAFPPKGKAEDKASAEGEIASDAEEEREEEEKAYRRPRQ